MDKEPEKDVSCEEIISQIENLKKQLETARRLWTFVMTNPINWPFPQVKLDNCTYTEWHTVWERFFEAEQRYREREFTCEAEIKRLEKLL